MDHVASRVRRLRLGAASTLVYSCGLLASVHSHKQASTSRASILPSLTILAGSITSLSVGVVGHCLISLLIMFALQPAHVPPYSGPVAPPREDTPGLEPGICGCGRVFVENGVVLKISWRRLPAKVLSIPTTSL